MNVTTRVRNWLLPTVLILFLLEIILLPFAAQLTYAGRSENPNHILTYTTGNLVWDSETDVDASNGVAMLNLFSSQYQNVNSENGDSVVAPGTENTGIVRLKNDVDRTITYVAVLYRIKEEETLPVLPVMADNESFTNLEAEEYPLPDGVAKSQVAQAVTGTVSGGQIQDFDISWKWNYYDNDQRDTVDTALGNKAAFLEPDDVTAGLYIVVVEDGPSVPPKEPEVPEQPEEPGEEVLVDPDIPLVPGDEGEDENGDGTIPNTDDEPESEEYVYPTVPETGDNSHMSLYLVLMALSAIVLVLLVLDRQRERNA